jgi:hypothetical protein
LIEQAAAVIGRGLRAMPLIDPINEYFLSYVEILNYFVIHLCHELAESFGA